MLFQLNRARLGLAQAAAALPVNLRPAYLDLPTYSIFSDIHKIRRLIDRRLFAEMLIG
jgi:hypothetical protein